MNILPFHLNIPAEITLERPEGMLVQGRYGDRVMFTLADGRVMYVPPFVASKIQAEAVAAGERFEVCKTQVKKRGRRAIEWIVRRLDPFDELACSTEPAPAKPSLVPKASEDGSAPGPEPETQLERDLRASINSIDFSRNGNGHKMRRQAPSLPHRPSWNTPSRPRSRPPIMPNDSAPNWATSCALTRTPSSRWRSPY